MVSPGAMAAILAAGSAPSEHRLQMAVYLLFALAHRKHQRLAPVRMTAAGNVFRHPQPAPGGKQHEQGRERRHRVVPLHQRRERIAAGHAHQDRQETEQPEHATLQQGEQQSRGR